MPRRPADGTRAPCSRRAITVRSIAWLACAPLALLTAVIIPACADESEAPSTAEATKPPPAPTPPPIELIPAVPPLALAPISYFQNKCALCHGAYGEHYGTNMSGGMSDDELRIMVRIMAESAASAPLTEPDVIVQSAFHRSMIDRRPFIAWTGFDAEGRLTGEVTPGASVIIRSLPSGAAAAFSTAEVEGHTWRAAPPAAPAPGAGAPPAAFEIEAVGPAGRTTLRTSDAACSHAPGRAAPEAPVPSPP